MGGDVATDPAAPADAPPATEGTRKWPDFYASLVEDVTKWAAARALVRAVPEMLPDALMIVDAAGAIVLVNTQLELMFGYHRSELLGQTPEVLLPPELRGQHIGLRQHYTDAPRPRTMAMASGMRFRTRRKNGTELFVHVMLSPVATPDGVGIIALIRRAAATGHAEASQPTPESAVASQSESAVAPPD